MIINVDNTDILHSRTCAVLGENFCNANTDAQSVCSNEHSHQNLHQTL